MTDTVRAKLLAVLTVLAFALALASVAAASGWRVIGQARNSSGDTIASAFAEVQRPHALAVHVDVVLHGRHVRGDAGVRVSCGSWSHYGIVEGATPFTKPLKLKAGARICSVIANGEEINQRPGAKVLVQILAR
jgi:hypothetical protein